MALFKLRKGRDEPPVPATPPLTVESMRRRAMHRLIGAAILVLAGVVGFPLFFDNQPRPIPVDLPIVIPDKAKAAPLAAPQAIPPVAVASAAPAAPDKTVAVAAPEAVAPPAPAPAAAPVVPADKPVAVPPVTGAKASEAGKALALLEGKDPAAKPAASEGRFIVQVGAFADADKVREVRRKVEALGVKTYTQVVDTKDGSRIRVRVGPFADKAEATRIAEKIRKLDLSASILSL